MITRTISANREGTNISRYLQALMLTKGNFASAAEDARQRWHDSPQVWMDLQAKTGVDPMSTGGAASGLTGFALTNELIEFVRPLSIVGTLAPKFRATPFRVKVPVETASVGAVWVPEGMAITVQSAAYSANAIEPFKLATSSVLSLDLARSSNPSAEATIRFAVAAAIAKFQDSQFIDPTLGPLAGERPQSATYNGQFFTSTGATEALIASDLKGMMAKLVYWTSPTWILPPRLAWFLTVFGAPGIGPNVYGIPALLSANCGNRIVLLDANDILYADGGIEIGISNEASLVLTDSPSSSPMATSLVSLWQNNLVSIRAIRFVSWLRAHSDSVVCMSISY